MVTHSEEETEAVGRLLAHHLRPGDIIALRGDLGAGKTVFVRGLHRGLGCAGRVRSPSFTTLIEYEGDPSLYHFDLYRYEEAGPAFLDEFAEWLGGGGVCVLEWGERLGDWLPAARLDVDLSGEGTTRRLDINGRGGEWDARLSALSLLDDERGGEG